MNAHKAAFHTSIQEESKAKDEIHDRYSERTSEKNLEHKVDVRAGTTRLFKIVCRGKHHPQTPPPQPPSAVKLTPDERVMPMAQKLSASDG